MNKDTTSPKFGTDLKRLGALKDDDIDFSDIAEVPPEMFANAVMRKGLQSVRRESEPRQPVESSE